MVSITLDSSFSFEYLSRPPVSDGLRIWAAIISEKRVCRLSGSLLAYYLTHLSYVMRCAILYHLYNLRNVKNTHGRMLLLVKLQAEACSFTKSNTPLWVFLTFLKLHKWYKIAQRIHYRLKLGHLCKNM